MKPGTQNYSQTSAQVIPFQRPFKRSRAQRPQSPKEVSPGFSWQWATENIHHVDELIERRVAAEGLLGENCQPYLMSGDQRLHGRLALAVCHSHGVGLDSALGVAIASEFLCAASRVRDCVNGWNLIRPTREAVWHGVDKNVVINLGDYFLALAYDTLAAIPCAPALRTALVRTFSQASTVITGQRMTKIALNAAPNKLMQAYEQAARDIVGTLLGLPVECALILAVVPKAQIRRTREALKYYGLIRQILSDVTALLENKPGAIPDLGPYGAALTAPVIWYLEGTDGPEREQLQRYLHSTARSQRQDLVWVERVKVSTAVQECYRQAAWIRRNVAAYLKQLPPSLKGCLQLALEESVCSLNNGDEA